VVAVASHDTASAVIASPLKNANAAYLFRHLVADGL
jgi:rhamnulokinase